MPRVVRLPKRSRVGEEAPDQLPDVDGDRVKRRRVSQSGDVPAVRPESLKDSGEAGDVSVQARDSTLAREAPARWTLSRPVAGRYSNLDPIFTADEKYVFVSLDTAVRIYSTATSRLFRTLQSETPHKIVAYKLCPKHEEHIYIFSSSGSVSKWDWASAELISRRELSGKILRAELSVEDAEDQARVTSYILRERKDGKKELSVVFVEDGDANEVTLLETGKRIDDFKIAQRGRIILVSANQQMLLGVMNDRSDSLQYVWRDVAMPVNVTCFDLRDTATFSAAPRDAKKGKVTESINLAIGESFGSVLILEDVLNVFALSDATSVPERSPIFRKMHWHRGPVNTVRWSRDGHYVISGGDEPVLVLWQLDTGRKQFLPHLAAPICNVTVSPSGNSYATKLANNSILVFSARELQPYATITGLQLPPHSDRPAPSSTDERSRGTASDYSRTLRAVLHPRHLEKLLIVVPASYKDTSDPCEPTSSCVLQTYDLRTDNHISRQALARTNATVLTVGPDGGNITTPDVQHLALSYDGKWMATGDSWRPDETLLKALELRAENAFPDHHETFVKFWRWNNSSETWELTTRVDGPHSVNGGAGMVLGLTARPDHHEFATMGDDNIVRFWTPTLRGRSGLKSANDRDSTLSTWRCRGSIDLRKDHVRTALSRPPAVCMDFSEDGSVLAICLQSMSMVNQIAVHLIDVQKGEIRHTRDGILVGEPCAIRFLGKDLIITSNNSTAVWDIINDAVTTVHPPAMADVPSRDAHRLLAVNTRSQTFAIAIQGSSGVSNGDSGKKKRKPRFHIQIYDIRSLELQDQRVLKHRPLALFADPVVGDYILVDSAASVVRIGCDDKTARVAVQTQDLTDEIDTGISSLFGSVSCPTNPAGLSHAPLAALPANASRQQKGIASIFGDGPSFNLPSLSVLFGEVVQSLAGR